MKKEYEALSVDVVKFEAQDVITSSLSNGSEGQGGSGDKGGELIPGHDDGTEI